MLLVSTLYICLHTNGGLTLQPFVPPSENRPELTARALILGSLFGLLFGAVTVYVGLRAGLSVCVSIPISVLSISILRALYKSSILENNIVQTTGRGGVDRRRRYLHSSRSDIFGIQFRVLAHLSPGADRRMAGRAVHDPAAAAAIVKEHGLLISRRHGLRGCSGGGGARGIVCEPRVSGDWLVAAGYAFSERHAFWRVDGEPNSGPIAVSRVGFWRGSDFGIPGRGVHHWARVAGILFAGGIFSWLLLMPAIHFFGLSFAGPIYPGTKPIAGMSPSELWSAYVRPMGAGAVAAAGVITLLKTMPTIGSAP